MKVKIKRTNEIRVEKETWKKLRETTITDEVDRSIYVIQKKCGSRRKA
jgi:ATP-dependent phosphoenolpyruvate carboxykinase